MTYTRPRRPCGRCNRSVSTGFHWPDGYVCVSCARRGVRNRGRCAGCTVQRPLPGVDLDGQPVCVDCAGIATSFRCSSCQTEGEMWFAHTCVRCSLRRRATELLADATGQVAVPLRPLLEAIASMTQPWSGMIWLQSSAVRERLHALATGAVPISHEGIDALPAGQGREYLRELLMAHQVIPARDKYLLAFGRWTLTRLDTIDDEHDRKIIRLYLRWRHQRELTARAAAGPLPASAVNVARSRINAGLRLLVWLRDRGVTLERCTQTDLDAWYASASNPVIAQDFITWAIRHRHCPTLTLPVRPRRSPTRGSEQDRTQVLARLLTDDTVELDVRVAGCLVLLLAQPVTRVAALRIAQIETRDAEVWIGLGAQPVSLPEPVGHLVLALTSSRRHMNTALHPTSPWLFPGHAPMQHLHPEQLRERLQRVGVRGTGRQASLHELATHVPAPLLAEALGYHRQTLTHRATETGTDWGSYAADKARSSGSR